MISDFGTIAIDHAVNLVIAQNKLIATNWALIAANEKLASLGERGFLPKDFEGLDMNDARMAIVFKEPTP